MKTMLMLAAIAVAVAGSAAEPVPLKMPTEITLTSGRVLRNVKVLGAKPDELLVQSSAGVERLPFAVIKEPSPEALRAIYEEARKPDPVKTRLLAQVDEIDRKTAGAAIDGQVFIVTKGAGAYKFAGVNVWLYSAEALESLESAARMRLTSIRMDPYDASAGDAWRKALEGVKPAGVATTDADGKFTLKVPEGRWFVFATARRLHAGRYEHTVWALPLTGDGSPLLLTQDNEWRPRE